MLSSPTTSKLHTSSGWIDEKRHPLAAQAAERAKAAIPPYIPSRSQPYDFQATTNYQKIFKHNASSFELDVEANLLAKPFCGQLKASGPAKNPLEVTSGSWHKDQQGELFWEPDGCRLRRHASESSSTRSQTVQIMSMAQQSIGWQLTCNWNILQRADSAAPVHAHVHAG